MNKDGQQTNVQPAEQQLKRKPGRPRKNGGKSVTVSISVSEELARQLDIARMTYEGNLSKYLTELIRRDLEKNLDTYQVVADLIREVTTP